MLDGRTIGQSTSAVGSARSAVRSGGAKRGRKAGGGQAYCWGCLGEILDRAGIAELVRDFRAGQEDLWKVAWLLLTTEVWMRTFQVMV